MTVPTDKATFRKAAAAARKRAHGAAEGAGQALVGHLPDLPRGAIVSGYAPIRSEIDPTPLMQALDRLGHGLCLPVIQAPATPLRFRSWRPGEALVEGAFGAAIPAAGAWVEPQVLLVPLLAFDRMGFRLGYGGGFYDRTLQVLRAKHAVMAIGLAYAAQEQPEVPREPTDQRLDAILTEQGLIRPEPAEAR